MISASSLSFGLKLDFKRKKKSSIVDQKYTARKTSTYVGLTNTHSQFA